MLRIGVFDSGVGGLVLLKKLSQRIKGVEFVYYGDNENAPYGNCSKERLKVLVRKVIDELLFYGVDCIVIACNTVSSALFRFCEEYSPVKVFGVFPPVEKAIMLSDNALLLCTNRTADEYFAYRDRIKILPLGTFVDFVEKNPILVKNDKSCEIFSELGRYEVVILGCTHYFYRKLGIVDHLKPTLTLDGIDDTERVVYEWFLTKNHKKNTNENTFIFIGRNSIQNQEVFFKFKNI
jgi:glutamate racemase